MPDGPKPFVKVGEVELLRYRVFPLDARPTINPALKTEICVLPGMFDVYSDGLSWFWMMTGCVNGNSIRRGDGMFIMNQYGDSPIYEIRCTFPSAIFGPDEMNAFLKGPICTEGDPDQRYRFTLKKKVK